MLDPNKAKSKLTRVIQFLTKISPIDPFIKKHGLLILDGGLATELEKMGFDLNTHLWSAQLLDSNPEAIRKVHLSYLKAGADCIISASYQASISGFISKGFSEKKVKSLLERAGSYTSNEDIFIKTEVI